MLAKRAQKKFYSHRSLQFLLIVFWRYLDRMMKTTKQTNHGAMRPRYFAVIIIEVGRVFCSVWAFPREFVIVNVIFSHAGSSYVAVNIV